MYEIVDVTAECPHLTDPGQVVLQGRYNGEALYGAQFCVRYAEGQYVLTSDGRDGSIWDAHELTHRDHRPVAAYWPPPKYTKEQILEMFVR